MAEERYRAVAPYEPRQADELRLARGDVITLTQKPTTGGWWEGRVAGKLG